MLGQQLHQLAFRLTEVRKTGVLPWLRPDGKTQVTVVYEGDVPVAVDTVVVSTQHAPEVEQEEIHAAIALHVVLPVLRRFPELATDDLRVLVNPTGRFVIGGPQGDAGLTGRKIIVDTYGGASRHGGGAFSGKDPSKVDRSAAYAMRWVAKNVVASGLAARCEVQIAYAIGVAEPVGIYVNTFGTGVESDSAIADAIRHVFDLRPAAIIDDLGLLDAIYSPTAAYGHFGRDEFPWEQTNRVTQLRDFFKG